MTDAHLSGGLLSIGKSLIHCAFHGRLDGVRIKGSLAFPENSGMSTSVDSVSSSAQSIKLTVDCNKKDQTMQSWVGQFEFCYYAMIPSLQ